MFDSSQVVIPAARTVHDGYEVRKPRNVGYLGAPALVRPPDRLAPQRIGMEPCFAQRCCPLPKSGRRRCWRECVGMIGEQDAALVVGRDLWSYVIWEDEQISMIERLFIDSAVGFPQAIAE